MRFSIPHRRRRVFSFFDFRSSFSVFPTSLKLRAEKAMVAGSGGCEASGRAAGSRRGHAPFFVAATAGAYESNPRATFSRRTGYQYTLTLLRFRGFSRSFSVFCAKKKKEEKHEMAAQRTCEEVGSDILVRLLRDADSATFGTLLNIRRDSFMHNDIVEQNDDKIWPGLQLEHCARIYGHLYLH